MATVIQLRGDTASNWTTANPILAERELALETDTGLYKIGDGVTAWNSLAYKALRTLDDATILNFTTQAIPTPPVTDTLNLFARPIAGRMMLRQQGTSGLSTPFQPSFFQNNITIINTNATTSVTSIGNTVANRGTVSHPVPSLPYGYMANFRSATTANANAGTGNTTLLWVRGANANDACGFFFCARIGLPDASYDGTTGDTGSRLFVGLANSTVANSVSTDNPTGHFCGFARQHIGNSNQHTNWQFMTKDGATQTFQDTGLVFTPGKVYDCYVFCAPAGGEVFWRIDNVTDGTSQSGSTNETLPHETTYMRGVIAVATVDPVARNIRMQRIYVESDR